MRIKVKKLHANAQIPCYKSAGAAGFDLHACESVRIEPHSVGVVPLGIAIEIENGFEVQVRSRSGLALQGISVLNSPGTIDSDYRGELQVILMNHTDVAFVVQIGDRIAQGVLARAFCATFEEAEILAPSERGAKGFGSTGI